MLTYTGTKEMCDGLIQCPVYGSNEVDVCSKDAAAQWENSTQSYGVKEPRVPRNQNTLS
jgi:hypothetical protein